MKIILWGLMFDEESLKEAYEYSARGVQMAPHKFQTNLLKGIEQIDNVAASVINVLPVGSYPVNYKKLFIKRSAWEKENVRPGYINLPWLKHKIQESEIIRETKKKLKNSAQEDTYIVIYHFYEPFLKCAEYIKKKYPEVHICLIATDCVPGKNDMKKYVSPKTIKKGERIVKRAKNCDSFVLLTKYMAEPLETGERKTAIVECICDEFQDACEAKSKSSNVCLYTGTLDREFGICELADAFTGITDAELWICGRGDAVEYISGLVQTHDNIKYLGFVDQKRVRELQNSCDFLINPRRPTGTYTKYSFPSKTAEYMMSARPVIMYKLEGIPDEYDEYLNYLKGETPEEIKNELVQIFAADYISLCEKADRARDFVLNNKSSYMQAKKIVEMISGKE
ncbi:MAG: glycosyltransferase family 4 protein [Ruminococcaceae bacterium]|nr:glycosyltransferase family 4 protein [Oscillospiraceae bacterium]